jgi:hypothetical protein
MRTSPLLAIGIGCIAALLAGCGGGGGGAAPGAPNFSNVQLTVPGTSTINVDTTYSVWETSSSGSPVVGIAPVGGSAPSSDPGWAPVTTGALILYPDGSTQVSDVLGNFDASQSQWAINNAAALAANPNDNPEVWVILPLGSTQSALDTTVVAYAPPGSPTMVASSLRLAMGSRAPLSGSAPTELTSVTVYPRGSALFDNQARTYTVVGTDSDGNYVSLAHASVTWSLGGCTAAAGGAGHVTQFADNNAKASYSPPSSGTFTAPDAITASVTANGTTYCASGNAYYYDPSQGVTISGVLQTPQAKPVANGVVAFYGGGHEFYHGNLIAVTDANGNFRRTLPPNRTLSLVGGQSVITGGHASSATFYTLNPATVAAGAAGSTIAAANYQESVAFQNPFKPLPPIDRAIRDAYYVSGVTAANFPFNRPKSSESAGHVFKTCSLDAIINNQSDSTAGMCAGNVVASGEYYSGWSVTYVPASGTATQWIFTQPSSQEGGRHVLQVQSVSSTPAAPNGISDANTAGLANCTAPTACWTYQELYNPTGFPSAIATPIAEAAPAASVAGAILLNDGAFNETNTIGGAFNVYLLRNEYSVGHQTPNSPLYTHTMNALYTSPGASSGTIADNWYNGSGLSAGSINTTRTQDANDAGFTYTAAGTRQYYKGTAPQTPLNFNVAGTQNADHSGQMTITITSSPDVNEINAGAQLNFVSGSAANAMCPASPGSASYPPVITPGTAIRICGAIFAPNATNLSGTLGSTNGAPNIALFTVDSALYTNVLLDPNIGSALAFHL